MAGIHLKCRFGDILLRKVQSSSAALFSPHVLNQRSSTQSGIENRWPKGKAKVKGRAEAILKQHALNQRSPAEGKGKGKSSTQAVRPEGAETPSPGQRPGY